MSGREYRYAVIKATRKRRQLTVAEAARKVGVSRAQWYNLERGRLVSFKLVMKASRMLGLDIRDVVSLAA